MSWKKKANVEKYHMSLMQLTIFTGFVAGILGSLFCFLAHTFILQKSALLWFLHR